MVKRIDVKLSYSDVALMKKNYSKQTIYMVALSLLDKGELNKNPFDLKFVSKVLGLSRGTLLSIKKQFVTQGIKSFLTTDSSKPLSRKVIFDKEFEDKVIQLANTSPPSGFKRWTVRLLTKKVIEAGIVKKVSVITINRILRKRNKNLKITT